MGDAKVMLIIFKPFKVGDLVVIGGGQTTGTVDAINAFNTILATLDNKRIIIANVCDRAAREISANLDHRWHHLPRCHHGLVLRVDRVWFEMAGARAVVAHLGVGLRVGSG